MTSTPIRPPATPGELQAWRERLGLSIRAAARALGMSARRLGYLLAGERDGRPVAIPRLVSLAALGLEVEREGQADPLLKLLEIAHPRRAA